VRIYATAGAVATTRCASKADDVWAQVADVRDIRLAQRAGKGTYEASCPALANEAVEFGWAERSEQGDIALARRIEHAAICTGLHRYSRQFSRRERVDGLRVGVCCGYDAHRFILFACRLANGCQESASFVGLARAEQTNLHVLHAARSRAGRGESRCTGQVWHITDRDTDRQMWRSTATNAADDVRKIGA
jgi:hypothetical protein